MSSSSDSTAPPSASAEPLLARIGRMSVRRRRWVLVAWVAVLLLAVFGGHRVAGDWAVDYSTPGSESKAAAETISQEFPNLAADSLLVTWRSEDGAKAPAARAQVETQLQRLADVPDVGEASFAQARISPDGKTGLIEVPLQAQPATVALDSGERIVEVATSASSDAAQVRFGGLVMQQSQQGSTSSEGVGLTFALLILLLTFGSIVAAGLPIATALFGIGTGAAIVGILATFMDVPDWAESVALMVGLGVGIDYALLILTRHRAGLAGGLSVEDSVARALATAGRSVLIAGGTVVISLLGLLLMGLPYLVGVAFAASFSVLVVMVASLTLLPALLGFAGRRIDALAIPLPGARRRKERTATQRAALPAGFPADASPAFARWSAGVQRRPWLSLVAGLAIVVLLTAPLAGMRLGFPGAANEAPDRQARQSHEMLTTAFGAGVATPLQVVAPIGAEGAEARLAELGRTIERDGRVAAVTGPIASADGKVALLNVQSRTGAEEPASEDLLATLRDDLIPASGVAAKVGGQTAQTHDQSSATANRLPLLFAAVAGLSALLLLAAFRSVLIPIKAAVMNLLSIAAAYGVVALIAEGGAVGQLVGIDGEVPIPPFIPILMFAILFGLSMDYEVFLLGRIRELWLEHGDAGRAVTEGLAATARVITAAAAIMIAVFGAFGLSDEVFLKLIGIGMATAILVDATVIRLLLVPALMGLMGEKAWWMPGWLDRLIPEAQLEAPMETAAPADLPADPSPATDREREPVGAGASG
ncbi:MAG: MMPL family transporter [Solirubrobacteraceae bacterium]|nr:MMPL family transporter [Solirubrobacteraceae bacterium]